MPDSVRTLWFIVAFLCISACGQQDTTTIFLLRHAEKVEPFPDDDPPLTDLGKARAKALSAQLSVDSIHAFYSTDFLRTRQTLAPVSASMQAEIQTDEAHDYSGLADRVKQRHKGQNVLVAGHSNTVLPIIEALGAEPPLDSIGHQDYDYLFKVSLKGNDTSVKLMTFKP